MYILILFIIGLILLFVPNLDEKISFLTQKNKEILGCIFILISFYYYNNEKLFN